MIRKLMLLVVVAAITLGTGCSKVTVPPAHKGKLIGKSGYSPEILSTGRHTKDYLQEIILIDMSSNQRSIPLGVTMMDYDTEGNPRAGLTMNFEISFKYSIKDDDAIINTMFNDLKITSNVVSADQVLNVHAMPLILTQARDVISKYTPEEVLANRGIINQKLGEAMKKRLTNVPLDVTNVLITKMTLPPLIERRIQANKDKELKIAEENAQQAIEMAKRQNAINLARKDAERDLVIAKSAAMQNEELNRGLTAEVLELRKLRIQEIYAEALKARLEQPMGDGDTLVVPYESLGNTAMQMRMYQQQEK